MQISIKCRGFRAGLQKRFEATYVGIGRGGLSQRLNLLNHNLLVSVEQTVRVGCLRSGHEVCLKICNLAADKVAHSEYDIKSLVGRDGT